MLSALTVNRSFMREFIEASTPCFALGLVEEQGRQYGFLALRPEEEIPSERSDSGFSFGHSLYGSSRFEVLHFAFQFSGFQAYNVLLNPNNPLVRDGPGNHGRGRGLLLLYAVGERSCG